MSTRSQKLNFIQNFLQKNDRNGLAVWQDYLSKCLTFQDQDELIASFENDLKQQAAQGCEFSQLYFKTLNK
jgi:hypothetical protein